MSTLREIAEFAGVSVSTASMAVRDHHAISIDTKRRVWEAQEKLGYRPHLQMSRRVVRQPEKAPTRSVTIAYLLVDREFDDPAYSQGFQGIAQRVAQNDWRCLYLNTTLADLQAGILPSAIRHREVDGIIVGGLYDEVAHKVLSQCGIPLVVQGNYQLGEEPWAACEVDLAQGMRLLVRRLESFGHRRFGLLIRDGETEYEHSLRQWYLQEMAKPGRADAGVRLISENGSISGALTDQLAPGNRPDALILASATFGEATYEACEDLGISLPEDLSVAAFGAGLHILKPTLASVQYDNKDYGLRSMEKLAGLIEDPETTPTRECYPMRFVSGGSMEMKSK